MKKSSYKTRRVTKHKKSVKQMGGASGSSHSSRSGSSRSGSSSRQIVPASKKTPRSLTVRNLIQGRKSSMRPVGATKRKGGVSAKALIAVAMAGAALGVAGYYGSKSGSNVVSPYVPKLFNTPHIISGFPQADGTTNTTAGFVAQPVPSYTVVPSPTAVPSPTFAPSSTAARGLFGTRSTPSPSYIPSPSYSVGSATYKATPSPMFLSPSLMPSPTLMPSPSAVPSKARRARGALKEYKLPDNWNVFDTEGDTGYLERF
jgi:hypothetical protein